MNIIDKIVDFKINLDNRKRKNFLKRIPKNSVGAELGVFKGHFSRHVFDIIRPKKLYLIDPWWKLCKNWDWTMGDKSTVNAYIKVFKMFKDEIAYGKVEVIVDFDEPFLKSLPDGHLDWVYLDSSHRYKETKIELNILRKKVKAEGIITGHDWQPDPSKKHHGVYRAIKEFMEKYSYEVVHLDKYSQWCIKKKNRR